MIGERTFWRRIAQRLEVQDIRINGERPWDIQVHNTDFYPRLLVQGSLGLGEAYMDGWWDCERLDEFFNRILKARMDEMLGSWRAVWAYLKACLINQQTRRLAPVVGKRHYDIGNDLYRCMLDKRMIYSCGYWQQAQNLDEAQEAKLDLACRKLELGPDMTMLDIGCGWGGMAGFVAQHYDVTVKGITVSGAQVEMGREMCRDLNVDIQLMDYRELEGRFERIVSIGMFEHVGYKNYRTFMQKVKSLLAENELFLLQTIDTDVSQIKTDVWVEKYIFPNSMIPSAVQITKAAEGVMVIEDWQNFGADYEKTLLQWHRNFIAHWSQLKQRYSERFRRMWEYYLLSCAGAFRSRRNQLWQIIFSPNGVPGGYPAKR